MAGTLQSSAEVCGIHGLLKCIWENLREGGDVFSWASGSIAISKMRHQVPSFCVSPLKRRLTEGPNRTYRELAGGMCAGLLGPTR